MLSLKIFVVLCWIGLDVTAHDVQCHLAINISGVFPNGAAAPATEDEVGGTVFPCIWCFFFISESNYT